MLPWCSRDAPVMLLLTLFCIWICLQWFQLLEAVALRFSLKQILLEKVGCDFYHNWLPHSASSLYFTFCLWRAVRRERERRVGTSCRWISSSTCCSRFSWCRSDEESVALCLKAERRSRRLLRIRRWCDVTALRRHLLSFWTHVHIVWEEVGVTLELAWLSSQSDLSRLIPRVTWPPGFPDWMLVGAQKPDTSDMLTVTVGEGGEEKTKNDLKGIGFGKWRKDWGCVCDCRTVDERGMV